MNTHQRRRLWPQCAALCICAAALAFGSGPTSSKQARIRLVVNTTVDIQSLSKRNAADIFLGNKEHWNSGTRISLAVLDTSTEQKALLKALTGRSPSQYWSHWRHIVFSGKGFMPEVFTKEKKLVRYVAETKGAVGYITKPDIADRSNVRVIRIDQKDNH